MANQLFSQWFFGGAFETGDASSYNGNNLVTRSQALNEPVIFVAINYRLNGRLYSQPLDFHC